MAITTFSTTYTAMKTALIGEINKVKTIVAGVPDSVLSGISNRYIVTLRTSFPSGGGYFGSFQNLVINAYLQENIVFDSSSRWDGIVQELPGKVQDFISNAETLANVFGKSLITTLSTRRRWAGSEPLGITLKLQFEAVNNVEDEVLKPCMILQQLTLPRGGVANALGLTPPGPFPFKVSADKGWEDIGEYTSIDIGGFVVLNSVIVENVQVKFLNRMSQSGPVGAEVILKISSYEMLTKEGLAKAYKTIKPPTTGTLGAPTR